jgi:hypothetical protein
MSLFEIAILKGILYNIPDSRHTLFGSQANTADKPTGCISLPEIRLFLWG